MILNYKKYGPEHAPSVFFLHGLLGNADNWGSTCRELAAQGLHCIAVDQRNHGSSPHSSDMSYPLMAGDLLETADFLGIERFSIVGHSMGGKTAMETALMCPERTFSVVVADIAPVKYKPVYDDYINSLKKIELEVVKNRSDAGIQLEKYVPDRTLRMFFLTNLRKNDSGRFEWRINIDGITGNYENLWCAVEGGRSYRGPALFLKGSDSDFIQDEYKETIKELFPAYSLEIVENSGHWVHTEQPVQFRKYLHDFMIKEK